MLSRRFFLKGAALAAVGTMLDGAVRPASAALPPRVSRQAPGYFRLRVGDADVTAIYDGGVFIPPNILHGATPEAIDAALEAAFIDPKAGAPTAINAFLVDAGQGLVLVDTGVGTYFGDKGGLLAANIEAAGYKPGQVEAVLLTHLHSDHALGLVDGAGKALFPKAKVRVHEADVAYWLRPGAESRVTEGQRKVLPALRAAVAPYQAAGTFAPFATGETPYPGFEAELAAGHTPGHCGYRVRSKGESILFWGDIAHCMAVQFPLPGVTIDFDADQPQAAAARRALLARVAREKFWVAGAHLPFPGIGRLQAVADGYAWWPAVYAVPSGV